MKKYLYVLTSLVLMSLVSCVNEPFSNEKEHGRETSLVAALSEQAELVGATLGQLAQIQTDIDNLIENAEETQAQELSGCKTALQNVVASLESHLDYLKGATWLEGTMATIECQKALATVVASLEIAMGQQFDELESSVSAWVGKDFCMSYSAALALARVQLLGISLNTLTADVTEGLIVAKDSEELAALSVSIEEDAASYAELGATLDAVVSELTQEYAQAVEAVVVNNTSYDVPALAEFNSNVAIAVKSSTTTLNDLISRVAECEAQLEKILQTIKDLEAQVEGLLGMIQSVSFISDYSSDYAVAYYALETSKVDDVASPYYGKCNRTPVNTVELNFMVTPASAAKALTKENVSVFGYYANQLQPYAVNASSFIDFELDKVELVSESRGLVKVVVKHNLKESFYFKGVGAKCALSISTGKTDFVSKFVEIVPKDNSTTVYVQSITPSEKSVTIANGESMTLGASVYPEAASVKTCTWSSSNTNVVKINPSTGVLEAVGVGRAILTATSNGIDEWGLPVTATVSVVVNEAVRLLGPSYVEVGKTAELNLDHPASMQIGDKAWSTSDPSKLTVNKSGTVTGVGDTYQTGTNDYGTVTVSCVIDGGITVTHDMKVVVRQPQQIKLNHYGDDVNTIAIKIDQSLDLSATIMPTEVNQSYFRLYYESTDSALGWVDDKTGLISNPKTPGGRTVTIKVFNQYNLYYFAPGVSLSRNIIVHVNPYYVQTMKFAQKTVKMAPNQTSTLSPIFTSDVDGKQPTYKDLKWTSSNPSVVSVNENTGEITTHQEGTAIITATTTNGWSVPSGTDPKSASCTVVVEAPAQPVNVGDYFYSDGTWSSTKQSGKTIIGVIISNAAPATSDSKLMADYGKCTHGIVLGLNEYNSAFGTFFGDTYSDNMRSLYTYLDNKGTTPSQTALNGYGLTKTYGEYRDAYKATPDYSEYCIMFDRSTGIPAQQNAKIQTPADASTWYIPSYKEMQLIYESFDLINSKLSGVGAVVESKDYWSSTLKDNTWGGGKYHDLSAYPFSMSTGGWRHTSSNSTTSFPVRVVFAF